jgi:hypothetical protein
VSIYQLNARCWALDGPGRDDEGERHFDDAASADAALTRAREEDPETKASAQPPPPSAAELEAAGQLPLPGVPS